MTLLASTSWAQTTITKCANSITILEASKNLSNSTSTGTLQFDIGVTEVTDNGPVRDNYCTVSWPSTIPIIIKSSKRFTGLLLNLDHGNAVLSTQQGLNSCAFFKDDNHVNPDTILFHDVPGLDVPSDYHSHSFQAFSGVKVCRFKLLIPYTVTRDTINTSPGFIVPFSLDMNDYVVYQMIYARNNSTFLESYRAIQTFGTTVYPPVQCTVTPTNTTVTLPDVNASAFTASNPLVGATNFQFNWTSCSAYKNAQTALALKYTVQMSWSFNQDPNSTDKSHMANIADVGLASPNIVVVVKDKGPIGGTDPDVFIKNQDQINLGEPVNQAVNRNFTAYYKATSFPALPGAVRSTAVFTMTYQ